MSQKVETSPGLQVETDITFEIAVLRVIQKHWISVKQMLEQEVGENPHIDPELAKRLSDDRTGIQSTKKALSSSSDKA